MSRPLVTYSDMLLARHRWFHLVMISPVCRTQIPQSLTKLTRQPTCWSHYPWSKAPCWMVSPRQQFFYGCVSTYVICYSSSRVWRVEWQWAGDVNRAAMWLTDAHTVPIWSCPYTGKCPSQPSLELYAAIFTHIQPLLKSTMPYSAI